jgi:ribosomal protein S25
MRLLLAAVLCAVLLLPQGLAENVIKGTLTLSADGKIVFDGYISRDDLNISLAALNAYRETEIKPEQHVYMEFEGAILERRGEGWVFSLGLDEWFDEYDLAVNFPQGAVFKEISSNMGYERDAASLRFTGQLVESPKVDVVYSVEAIPEFPYHYLLVLAILVVAAVFALLKLNRKKSLSEEIVKTLNEKEKTLINTLFESGGKLTQTRLRQKTGLPKSTLSNVLRDLENRKLVNRYEHGSTWDIELDKRLYK